MKDRDLTELRVALHMRRRQLQPSRPKATKTSAEIEAEVRRFIDMIRDGVDSHEAANIVGVAYHTMRKRLYYRGLKLRDFHASREEHDATLRNGNYRRPARDRTGSKSPGGVS